MSGPLTREAAEGLLSQPSAQRALPEIHLPLPEEGDNFVCVACHLVYLRENGFMIVIPCADAAHNAVAALSDASGEDAPMFFVGSCEVETVRGRNIGQADVELVDLPWLHIGFFQHPRTGRQAVPRDRILTCKVADETGRPRRQSAHSLASEWLLTMEETTAQEYLTGEELEAEVEPERSPPASAQELASVAELKAQIQALKAQLASAQPAAVPPPPPKTPSLFNVGVTPKVSAADWTKLKQLAGSPPPRVGATETRRSLPARAIM